MKHLVLILLLLCGVAGAAPVEYKCWALREIPVSLAVCDVVTTQARIVLAQGSSPSRGKWNSENFTQLIDRLHPLAAITGPYFDMDTNIPVCTIISDGKLVVNGICCSYLMVGNGRASIGYNPNGGPATVQWPAGLSMGVAGGPILVRDRRVHTNQKDEGFSDPGIFGTARRTAVGVTPGGKLVLMATNTPIGLRLWSRLAYDAGLSDAFNLDGGTSAGLYGGGRYFCRPGRRLTSFLVVLPL